MDSEGNIKIGDFGLATTERPPKGNISENSLYQIMEDVSEIEFSDAQAPLSIGYSNSSMASDISESITGGVGTALYRAPEQEGTIPPAALGGRSPARTGRAYDAKADMFSMGIVLFEMCHEPFPTMMERIDTLTKLRNNGIMPSGFESRVPDRLRQIISLLVQTDPLKRPSAAELQASSLVPPRIDFDKKYLEEVTNALCIPNSETAIGILRTLFKRTNTTSITEHVEMTYDLDRLNFYLRYLGLDGVLHSSQPSMVDLNRARSSQKKLFDTYAVEMNALLPIQMHESLKKTFENVFLSHGAVCMSPSLLRPRAPAHFNPLVAESHTCDTCFEVMDKSGVILRLPGDLITPYARYVARLGITCSQRYVIDKVYRSCGNQHPQEMYEAVYDIIREDRTLDAAIANIRNSSNSVLDASTSSAPKPHVLTFETEKRAHMEVDTMLVAMELADAFDPSCVFGVKVLRVNDNRVTNAILDLCGVGEQRDGIYECLAKICDETIIGKNNSLASSQQMLARALDDVSALNLSANVVRALKPFVRVLLLQADALTTVRDLEKVT